MTRKHGTYVSQHHGGIVPAKRLDDKPAHIAPQDHSDRGNGEKGGRNGPDLDAAVILHFHRATEDRT